MDTNEKSGTAQNGQPEQTAQPRGRSADQQRSTGNRAPRMDGVSAGGRPQRPVPRSAASAQKRVQKSAGVQAEKNARPVKQETGDNQKPAQAGTVRADQRTERPKNPQQEEKRPQRRPAAAGEAPARKPQAANRPAAQTDAAQKPQKKAAPSGAPKKAAPSGAQKKRKTDTAGRERGDSGYQPYRRANERRKAQRSSSLRAFFSDQNPVLKWFERVRYNKDSFAEESDLARQRQARRAAEQEKRRKRQNRFNTPAVIYTQPAAFNRDRLIVQLISVLTVVVALMVGLSVFFKVGRITVSGAEVYQPWSIVEASGISKGENLLTLSRARATSQILANLPYVKKVRIGIKLPDTVNIEVEEGNVAYAIKDDQGTWWLMDSDAKVTEMINNSVAGNYTQVLGVTLSAPKVGDIGVATELQTEETGETQPGEETLPTVAPIVVTGAERLGVAQQILKSLENNDIVGGAASVDVSAVDEIVLQYGSRYEVMLGDSNNLDYKIACMIDAILQMSDYQTGILDVSFTTWENQVALTPFE